MVSLGSLLKHIVCGQVFIYIVSIASTFQNYATGEVVYMSMDIDIGVPGDVTAVAMKYESMVGVSLESCVDHCKRRSFCSYISYATNAHMCSIIKHVNQSQTATFRKRPGYVLGKKAEWDMASYADCVMCNATCVRGGNSTMCKNTGCGPPVIPENAYLLGNMYTIGSRLLLKCMDSTWSPQDQVQITCLSSGVWTSTNLTCIPETTTTTKTPPPLFSCVSFNNLYRTVTLEDSTTVTYKLVDEPRIPKDNASQDCKSDGGELIKVVTPARLAFVLQLTACPDMPSDDIWIDGTNYRNETIYETTDGDVVPMSNEFNEFWPSGEPNNLRKEHCIRLKGSDGFKLATRGCSSNFSYMCELL